MPLRHPSSVAHASLLVKATWKRYVVGSVFVALYACSLNAWQSTAGQPYQWALEEQKRELRAKVDAAREVGLSFASGQQDRKETDLEIDEASLPPALLPSAWACAFIFCNITVHILFHLMCVWSISFKAFFLFQPIHKVHRGCFIRLTPHANKGKADICVVEESEIRLKYNFTFQYQGFEFIEAGEADSDLSGDVNWAGVRQIQCPTNLRWSEYQNSKGLKTESEVEIALDKFNKNLFELPRPTFWQLYQKQLLAPLAIFQLFCTALWMLDTYWKYTCFTLFTVLGFEASTAFQRLKSMATMRGMGPKGFDLYVFRLGKWQDRPIGDLLPGDIISLRTKNGEEKLPKDAGHADAQNAGPTRKDVTVPCDCLILAGSAIVNEATLTGESVPQMKDAISAAADEHMQVDAFGKHRIHALFSGTSLIQANSPPQAIAEGSTKAKVDDARCPPDGGIVCFVLRTGFNSSQGELMRMIEFSTENVGADKIETALQLIFLLMFALVAAGYVLKKGLEDPTKPTYKVLLRCTLIITSVVPPSLPMQMALAVHTALMSLTQAGIFCTEPFRVPYAGRVSYCFFDKTGTLTSDQMVAVGVVNGDYMKPTDAEHALDTVPVKEACPMLSVVLAGCHSLIEVDGKAIGDPIEVAALKGISWSYLPSSSTASPTAWRSKELFVAKQREYMGGLKDNVEADKKEKVELAKKMEELDKSLKQDKLEAKKLQVTIQQRFHFSSELQRMSTICKVFSSTEKCQSGSYCLVKGSPEAIGRLLVSKPDWYEETYTKMAEKGHRVLALAYSRLGAEGTAAEFSKKPREASESNLTFAGFIAFKCETRKDSMLVIKALRDSAHTCVMLTGDAPLTALSVAVEVGIALYKPEKALVLSQRADGGLEWQSAITSCGDVKEPVHFDPCTFKELSKACDLIITGATLEMALQGPKAEQVAGQLSVVRVFARLSPLQKEQVIVAVRKSEKAYALMCGDGGNDVGALKEADVGLALLSGFGNANVSLDAPEKEKSQTSAVAEEALEELRKQTQQRGQAIAKKGSEEMARKRQGLMAKQQEWVEEEMQKRRDRGEDTGVMGQMSAMKAVLARITAEMKKEQEVQQKKHGNAFSAESDKWAEGMDALEDTPMVQLGDASTAAPFTTRTPSISSCVDIIRQGRCTLLSAVQQMEIMMLESMIAAYTMSTMSVDGTRPSEAQLMASGTLLSVASLAFSFAKPLDRMHPVKPLASVFHPAILFSMLGQLAVHLCCMVYIAGLAKEVMGEAALREIIDFEKERDKKIEGMDEASMSEWNWFMSVPFKSNLLNTCCWLVETSQQISVIFVNYKGRPWMKGMLENQPLFLSLFICLALVAICAWGCVPYLNQILNLEVVPEELRFQVMGTLLVSLVGSFCWDRLMVALFAPHIMAVQIEEAKATRFADFVPLFQTVGQVAGGGLLLVSGNPILWVLGFVMYRKYKQATGWQAAQAQASPQAQLAGQQ